MSFDRSKIILDWSKQTETPSLQILKILIGRKSASTGRNRQRLPLSKILKFYKFRSIEKQDGPIELGRGSPYFLGKTQF